MEEAAVAEREPVASVPRGAGEPLLVDIEKVVAGRGQPRRRFDEQQLEELAASIREQGIIQPLVVVPRPGGYELVAGERRLRAAAKAGLEKVPVVIRSGAAETDLVEVALVENLQREDLSALERARAYERLIESHGYTQEQVAARVGKARASVANTLRLLGLPRPVRDALEEGILSEGHARALLGLASNAAQIETMRTVVRKELSVRETEALVRAADRDDGRARRVSATSRRPPSPVEQNLGRALGTKVRVRGSDEKGRIEIEFYSKDELTRLIERLSVQHRF